MSFSDWLTYLRVRLNREDGQTMAEYGVVLAVVCLLTLGAFTALSEGVDGALERVVDLLGDIGP